MNYRQSTPTFNTDRKVINFKDFDIDSEKIELDKIKKSYKKNELEVGQKEKKYKYNKVTRKLDDMDIDEVNDKIESLDEQILLESEYFQKEIPILAERNDEIGSLAKAILYLMNIRQDNGTRPIDLTPTSRRRLAGGPPGPRAGGGTY